MGPDEPPTRVDRGLEAGVQVVAIDGDLDLGSVEEVEAAVAEALDAGPAVVIDLIGVHFMDSTGMRTVIEARRRSLEDGTPLVLACALESATWRLLELTGTQGFFEVAGSRAAAVERLAAEAG